MISDRIPRAALVTGAAKRIGRAIALALAEDGFAIAVHYGSSRAEAEQLVAEIAKSGRRAAALQADLAQESQAAALVQRATAAVGALGVLVNNASTFERVSGACEVAEGSPLDIESTPERE